jgi:hypothetical protein
MANKNAAPLGHKVHNSHTCQELDVNFFKLFVDGRWPQNEDGINLTHLALDPEPLLKLRSYQIP